MSNLTEVLNQKGSFYLPRATNYHQGIANFYEEHFVVIDGQVTIKKSYIDGIVDAYYKEHIKKLKLEGSYASDKLVHKLYSDDNELISTTEVTLPFSKYVNDVQIYIDTIVNGLENRLVSQREYDEDMLVITKELGNVDTKISTAINTSIYNVLNTEVKG
jgi:hypothetical protein